LNSTEEKGYFECRIDGYKIEGGVELIKNIPTNKALTGLLNSKKRKSMEEDSELQYNNFCVKHNKVKEIVCLTDKEWLCTECVLFGIHQQHKYVWEVDFLDDQKNMYLKLEEE